MKKLLIAACLLVALPLMATAQPAVNFRVVLSGDNEVPPVATDTSGVALLHVDWARSEIRFDLDIANADGILGFAGAHFHCAPAGVNGPVVAFLAGATNPPGLDGRVRISATLNDGSIILDTCGATIAELVDAMLAGDVYINVHSIANPGGEIRGQIR